MVLQRTKTPRPIPYSVNEDRQLPRAIDARAIFCPPASSVRLHGKLPSLPSLELAFPWLLRSANLHAPYP